MSLNTFNETINFILKDGEIENISIPNSEELKNIVFEENINNILFNGFKKNYIDMYGDDQDYFIMKTQDLLYNLHLFINYILKEKCNITREEDIYDAVFNYIINNSDLYDSVNYDDSDLELIESKTINQSKELI